MPEPKMPTSEEIAKIQKERAISDGKLLNKGAEYQADKETGEIRLEITPKQHAEIHKEMEMSFLLRETEANKNKKFEELISDMAEFESPEEWIKLKGVRGPGNVPIQMKLEIKGEKTDNKPALNIATYPVGEYEEAAHVSVGLDYYELLKKQGYTDSKVLIVYNSAMLLDLAETGKLDAINMAGFEGNEKGFIKAYEDAINSACEKAGVKAPKILRAGYSLNKDRREEELINEITEKDE